MSIASLPHLRVEIVPFLLNACITLFYLVKGDEPGKTLYWTGATILTMGLYRMKG